MATWYGERKTMSDQNLNSCSFSTLIFYQHVYSKRTFTNANQYIDSIVFDRKPASLYEPIKYSLSMGGKRIRPMLMLLTYQLYKNDPQSILPVASALETYHNYTLLHDDLMDNALLRRGQPTVHKKVECKHCNSIGRFDVSVCL